jgi:hypothetical protein
MNGLLYLKKSGGRNFDGWNDHVSPCFPLLQRAFEAWWKVERGIKKRLVAG